MNGRCETDPFDQAINVCGLCYGEFCQTCLVAVKGRQHPLCKDCAIVSAGLRAGAKPVIRGSRKTAKARRTELAEAPHQAGFEYFDVQPLDPEATASEVVDALRAASETYSEPGAGDIAENGGAKQKRKRRSKKDQNQDVSPVAKKASKKASKKAAKATSKALAADADKADADADPNAVPAGPSAVNQLDKIRGTAEEAAATDDEDVDIDEMIGGVQPSFRKPRPFIKSPDGSAAAKPATARSGSKPKTKSNSESNRQSSTQSNAQSNALPKRRGGETAAPRGNTGEGLPRRRATPDSGPVSKSAPATSGSEVTARAENAAATESASGDLPRRRSRGKEASANGSGSQKSATTDPSDVPPALQKPGAKKGPATKPAGKNAAGKKAPAPTHRAGQETAAVKDRRRPKESGQASKAKPQSSNTMSDQVEPPAWTQKTRQGTKADSKGEVKGKEAESSTLPKRRRKGGPPKSVAG